MKSALCPLPSVGEARLKVNQTQIFLSKVTRQGYIQVKIW